MICTAKQCPSTSWCCCYCCSWWSIGTSMKCSFRANCFSSKCNSLPKNNNTKKKLAVSCIRNTEQMHSNNKKIEWKEIQFKGKQLDGTAQTRNEHASQSSRDLFNNKVYLIIVNSANTLIHTINAICILIRREQFSLRNQTNVRGKTSVTKTLCKIKKTHTHFTLVHTKLRINCRQSVWKWARETSWWNGISNKVFNNNWLSALFLFRLFFSRK